MTEVPQMMILIVPISIEVCKSNPFTHNIIVSSTQPVFSFVIWSGKKFFSQPNDKYSLC